MEVIAFTGPSGTGKSYRSLIVAKNNGADGIIDDGLLISNGRVIAGTSAKKESTRIASVKHALFIPPKYAAEQPSIAPAPPPMAIAHRPTSNEIWPPFSSRVRRSRPN